MKLPLQPERMLLIEIESNGKDGLMDGICIWDKA